MLTLVWIDTTELRASFNLTTSGWPELLALARQGAISVAVSEVSIREVSRQYAKELQAGIDRINGSVSDVNRKLPKSAAVDEPVDLLSEVHAQIDEYPKRLRALLEDSGITIAGLPEVTHESLLDREMTGRKPFSESGGYRDALIWESLLAEIRLDDELAELIVVTGNTRDFCDSKSNPTGLHPDLLREVDETGTYAEAIWFDDLSSAMDTIRLAVKHSVWEYLDAAFDEVPSRRDILAQAVTSSAEGLEGSDVPISLLEEIEDEMNLARHSLMDGNFSKVHADPTSVEAWIYEEYEGDTFGVSVSVSGQFEIQAYIERDKYSPGLAMNITDSEVDDVYQVAVERSAEAQFNIILISDSVESSELDHIALS